MSGLASQSMMDEGCDRDNRISRRYREMINISQIHSLIYIFLFSFLSSVLSSTFGFRESRKEKHDSALGSCRHRNPKEANK